MLSDQIEAGILILIAKELKEKNGKKPGEEDSPGFDVLFVENPLKVQFHLGKLRMGEGILAPTGCHQCVVPLP